MTILAIGASATVNLNNDGLCKVATNGGLASVSVTPTGGVSVVVALGPLPVRQTFGPFAQGAILVISNQTATLDYTVPGFDPNNVLIMGGVINGVVIGRQADLEPIYIESITGFGVAGTGTPTGLTNYPDGTANAGYLLTLRVTGGAGQNTLTINSGVVADAAGVWAGVIAHSDGSLGAYTVRNATGSTLSVFPALVKDVSNGILSNLHNMALGQHYTESGYAALADYIYNYKPIYGSREKYLTQWEEVQTTGWALVGGLGAGRVAYNYSVNNFGGMTTDLTGRYSKGLRVSPSGAGANSGVSQTLALGGGSGVIDVPVSSNTTQTADVSITVDGNVVFFSKVTDLTRIVVPFSNATTAVVQITGLNTDTPGFYVGSLTAWKRPVKGYARSIFPDGARVVLLGDSWTRFYNQSLARRLQKIHKGEIIDVGMAGQTAAWGLANFDALVTPQNPDVVLIEFFTNDNNAGTDGGLYTTWKANIAALIAKCKAIGAQPVILMPCPTASTGQTAAHSIMSALLAEGVQG